MAVPATRLKPPPPADDPARVELRRLVGEHAAFKNRRALLTAAESAAADALSAARQSVTEAEAALETARTAAARHIVDVSAGGGGTPPASLKDARLALQDAVDRRDAAAAACEQIRAELASMTTAIELWPLRLREAAVTVLAQAPAIGTLIADLGRAQREMLDRALALRFLIRAGAVDLASIPAAEKYGQPTTAPARAADALLDQAPIGWLSVEQSVSGAGPWRDALDRLLLDADAPLPG